jgi:hypothetical protein
MSEEALDTDAQSADSSHPVRGIVVALAGALVLIVSLPIANFLAARDSPLLNHETLSSLFFVFALALLLIGAYQIFQSTLNSAVSDVLIWKQLDEPPERRRVSLTVAVACTCLSAGCLYMAMNSERSGVVWWSALLGLFVFLASTAIGTFHRYELEQLKSQIKSPPVSKSAEKQGPQAIQFMSGDAARVAEIRAQLIKYADTAPTREEYEANHALAHEWMTGAIGLTSNIPLKEGKYLLFYETMQRDNYGSFLECVNSLRAAAVAFDESYLP